VVALVSLAGCRDRAAPPEPPLAGLSIDLTPSPGRGDLTVEVRVGADRAAGVTQLAIPRAWADTRGADAIDDVAARDADGAVRLLAEVDEQSPDHLLRLERAPRGTLTVRYRALAGTSRFAVRVGKDRLTAVGHAFLLLPRIDGALPARLRFHLGALGAGADAASSFGFGTDLATTATTEELSHAIYVAGKLWLEQPEKGAPAVERNKNMVIVGSPPFDARTAWTFAMTTLSATDRRFAGPDPGEPDRLTFFLAPEPGLGRAQDGAYLTRSLGLWFDEGRGLDPEIELTVAHELTHRWLGGTVRLVDADGRDAAWFSEGFTVHFARRILLDAGLVQPRDLLADVRRTLGEAAPGEEPMPADYRRGAQIAAYFDAALRRATGGARSLDDVARALVARAREERRVRLPVEALREVLARDLGPQGAADLDRFLARSAVSIELPEDAFGPCFKRSAKQVPAFELGFDRSGLHGNAGLVHGLVKGSAAERAGLREGALVLSATIPREEDALRLNAEVELMIGVGRNKKRIRYRPIGKRFEARWDAAPCVAGK
jgi:hypothetical protein